LLASYLLHRTEDSSGRLEGFGAKEDFFRRLLRFTMDNMEDFSLDIDIWNTILSGKPYFSSQTKQ
jgi:hypothetical protein